MLALSLSLASVLSAQTVGQIQNPTFADKDGDGTPDGWNPYPPGNGDTLVLASAPGGGLIFKDNDKSNGLGLEQWIPVQEGQRYTASAEATGTGGITLNLIFAPKKPNKPGDLKSIQLSDKAVRITPGKASEVVAVAPAGAKWMKLWLYCPKIGIADLVIQKVGLTFDTPTAAATAAPAPTADVAATPPSAPAAAPAAVAPTGPVPQGNLLKNSTFADSDGDGTPDGWNPYPPGNGDTLVLAPAPGGGLTFKDNDKNNGLGLEQWVPVQEGLRYTASAEATGTEGVSINLIFAPKKPNKPGDLKSIQLGDKALRISPGKTNEIVAVAPAGAKWMKFWLYCPKIGTADTVIRQVSLTAGAPAASAAPTTATDSSATAPATTAPTTAKTTAVWVAPHATNTTAPATEITAPKPLPPGLAAVIDFETGDFSQAHGTEGGDVSIVKAGEGPVREGKFSAKSNLKLNQHRAEVGGFRSDAYGIARYGWSLYIPKEFDAFTHFSIITQWHSWGSGKESPKDGGPPTSMTISKGKLQLKLLHQGDTGWTSKANYFSLGTADEMRDQWTDFVMEVNWQPPGKGGWLKFYKNGQLIVDYKGTTWFEDKDKGPYFKFGNYKGSVQWKGTEEGAILYLDAARMALGENSTYKMVDPAAYSPRPAPTPAK